MRPTPAVVALSATLCLLLPPDAATAAPADDAVATPRAAAPTTVGSTPTPTPGRDDVRGAVGRRVDVSDAKVGWTPARMRAAEPLAVGRRTPGSTDPSDVTPGSGARIAGDPGVLPAVTTSAPTGKARDVLGKPWRSGGGVARSVGKLFFTTRGRDAVCSASVVAGLRADLLLTAGHCVHNAGRWVTDVAFVPGYRKAAPSAPYGIYDAEMLWTTRQWVRNADWSYDVAYIDLATNDGGQQVGQVVGSQGLAFSTVRQRIHAFGYPAAKPYDGERLIYCSDVPGRDRPPLRTYRMRCNLTAGASGGPWLVQFRASTGVGYAVSVNSYKYRGDRDHIQGPLLGKQAESIYTDLQPIVADGTFLRDVRTGRFYRVAGGAPIDVASWAPFGGPQPYYNVLHSYIARRLRSYPADGTYLTAAQTGRIYRVALGAPIRVTHWDEVGGVQPTITVDNVAIKRHRHLRAFAGTGFIRGFASGEVYRVVDGHPYWIRSWEPWGGPKPYVDVDETSIDACDHLRCGPFGGLDPLEVSQRTVRATGWAMDPNSDDSVRVRLLVDGKVRSSMVASRKHAGLESRYHRGNRWGYSFSVEVGRGRHQVCAVATDVGVGTDGRVGCRTVQVR